MKQIFNIPEIHCASCVMLLETLEDENDAIRNVAVNLNNRTAEIEFDETKMNTNDVIAAIKESSNYEATANND